MDINITDESNPKAQRAGELARELLTAWRSDDRVRSASITAVVHEVLGDRELLVFFLYSQAVLADYAINLAGALASRPRLELQMQFEGDHDGATARLLETLMRVHLRHPLQGEDDDDD